MGIFNRKSKKDKLEELEKQLASFEERVSKIQGMYRGEETLQNKLGGENIAQTPLQNIDNVSLKQMQSFYSNLSDTNVNTLRDLSKSLEYNEVLYWKILRYYAYMFTWDYTYTLQEKDEPLTDEQYAELYKIASNTVDGMFLQVFGPELLLRLFSQGRVCLTTIRNNTSKTVSPICLPANYCRITGQTQFGVETIAFNFKYFADLNKNAEDTAILLTQFPKEFTKLYNQYLVDHIAWKELDPRYSGAISMNDSGVPAFLKSYSSLQEYQQYKSNELEKNSQELEKILTLKIPTYQDRLVLDVNEMVDTHQNLAPIVSRLKGVKLLTSYGDFDMLDLRRNTVAERDVIDSSLKTFYQSLGVNSNLFTDNTVESLKLSRSTDESLVFHYIKLITNFLEGALNNWYRSDFKKSEVRIAVLDITIYNREEKLTQFRENATFGVNKIEFMVASGIRQSLLKDKQRLEEYLDLKLVPLTSSHTLVGNQVGNEAKDEIDSPRETTDVNTRENIEVDNE